MDLLVEFPAKKLPHSFADSYFQIGVEQIGEGWRRFIQEQQRFQVFKLAGLQHADFMREYRSMQAMERSCALCFDMEFTSILLHYIHPEDDDNSDSARTKAQCLNRF